MLGFRREDIVWSLREPYRTHQFQGTKDPLATALTALAENRWCGVEAAASTSKSYTLGAGALLWFLACWDGARVFTVAPREKQLELNLWKEVTKMWPRFSKLFPQAELNSLKIRMRGGIDDTWSAHAIVAKVGSEEDVAGTMRGFHEAHQLFIMEEGSGIADAIWNTVTATSGGSHNLVLGLTNPDSVHDPHHRFCMMSRVVAVRISGFDHPNVVCEDPDLIPGAITRQWITDRAEEWGEGSNRYQRFVQGIAPAQAEDSLIQLEWCEAAAKRQGDKELREGPLALGVDVADSPTGDASAFSHWQGAVCTHVQEMRLEDASAVGREIFRLIKNPDAPIDPKRVGLDSVGVGVSAANELKRLGVRVRHISGGMRAGPVADVEAKPENGASVVVDVGSYTNLRSQGYWRLREDLRLGRIGLPNDPELFRQLTAHTYRISPTTGKTEVSPKDEVRAKLRRSPDLADSLMYGNLCRYRRVAKADPVEEERKPVRGREDDRLEKIIERTSREQKAMLREHKNALRQMMKRRA